MDIDWVGALLCIAGILGYIFGIREEKQNIRRHAKISSMPYFLWNGSFLKPGGEYYLIKKLISEESTRIIF